MASGKAGVPVSFDKIQKSFGPVRVLEELNLQVEPGEFLVLLGASGSGKTTALRILSGLETASAGRVLIGNRDVTNILPKYRDISMVFQSYALYPHMTVRQNLAFGLENIRLPKAEIASRTAEAARMLEIEPYLDRRPGQLSGGQKQRVAIGRAVVRNPTAFLLDEPLSNLDAELRISTRAEIAALHKRLATTMIYVTHDQIEAMTLADRIVVMRAGKIEQIGRPLELYNRPANLFVAGFIGAPRMNLIKANVTKAGPTGVEVTGPGGLAAKVPVDGSALMVGADVTLGVRPHDLVVADANGIAVEAKLIEALGPETVVHAEMPDGQKLVAVLSGQKAHGAAGSLRFDLQHEKLHLFDSAGLRVPDIHAVAR